MAVVMVFCVLTEGVAGIQVIEQQRVRAHDLAEQRVTQVLVTLLMDMALCSRREGKGGGGGIRGAIHENRISEPQLMREGQ
jgi:hypothetical protein